jgi:hypothetical protein
LADSCREGIAGRGLGLVAAARGETLAATAMLLDALSRCGRLPDGQVWGTAHVLAALCALAIARGDDRVPMWVGID